jgi:TPR repeat protein
VEAKSALERAEKGDAKAQDVMARFLMSGRGVRKDEAEGIKWLCKSLGLRPDDPDFQIRLGKMYKRGVDVTENHAEALRLFQKAAAKGRAEAQFQIGEMYDFGESVAKDPAEAMRWFRRAAESGNANAQFEIGVRHAQGRDLKEDYVEALKWLRKAADQCHPEALAWMANMYKEGWGVAKDPLEAYFWDRLAVAYKTIYGERVSARLTPEQLAAVDQRVADWISTHPQRPYGWQFD